MKKTILILGLAALTAAGTMTARSTTAEAGKGARLGLGIGIGVGLGMALQSQRQREPVYRERVYRERAPSRQESTRRKPEKEVVEVALVDGKGREYDPASKVWFDGKDACWTGKQKWTFKSGNWHYGTSRWYESGGVWKTSSNLDAAPVDCISAPLFASRLKPNDQKSAAGRGNGNEQTAAGGSSSDTRETPPRAAEQTPMSPEKDANLSKECKKYFPNVGQSVSVPCT